MALAFVPVYVRVLGVEAFGLIAFYTTLQTAFSIIDLGLTTTLSRELAVRAPLGRRAQEDVLRTLEAVHWVLALGGSAAIVAGSGWIARDWIQADSLPVGTVRQNVALMGAVLAFQWPLAFYLGGLLGLQRQVLQNVLLLITATMRYGGAAVVLLWVTPTLSAFFLWQLAVNAMGVVAAAASVWASVGGRPLTARFSLTTVRQLWRFTAGMAATSVAALLWSQIDKILLSRLLTLEIFAQYSLAALVAGSLYVLVLPVGNALLPALSRSVARADVEEVGRLYHLGVQFAAVLMIPVACVLAAFAGDVLVLWTGEPFAETDLATVLRYLALGVALNGLIHIAHVLQLAYGHTRTTLVSHAIAVAVTAPALIVLAPRYGARAAALIWLVVNLGYAVVQIPIVHARFLPGHLRRWYFSDVAAPAAGAALTVAAVVTLVPDGLGRMPMLGILFLTTTAAFVAAVLCASEVRRALANIIWNPALLKRVATRSRM